MAILTINDNPSISDTVVFTLKTPDANGCLLSTPYEVNSVVIYYVERDFTGKNVTSYEDKTYDTTKLQAAEVAEAIACSSPTLENITNAKILRSEAESNVSVNPFYFTEATPIQVVGNAHYPAWLSTDLDNAFLELVDTCEFTYTWNPEGGVREGDYFICWTWTPLIAGGTLSDSVKFSLAGNTLITTSIPTHYTDPAKYTTLMDRYTPEMFKMMLCDSDLTPEVIQNFGLSVASGFKTLEDLTNQIVDLQDANSVAEPLLPYLSNLFGLKLKTNDPTRWRGQIKRAIPLSKMKGTRKGLSEAFEHANIKMLKLSQLWQIISSYTWQESFVTDGVNLEFVLEKVALPIDFENFELWIRPQDESDWIQLTSDYVEFITDSGSTTMTWIGSTLSVDPIDLIAGDEIRVLYLYNSISPSNQAIESYIRMLPLMDQREERNQSYPPKNWNVRVIAPDDPLFNLVIPDRNPFCDPLIYGKVRTEFPYSENIYNMEEYNGSIRNSKNPCDIDKSFIDPCTACISSSYNVDLEIDDLTSDRILEAQEVLTENTPFHAVLHTLNFIGGINEFVESPVECIEALISISGNEFVIAGDAQMYFNRIMKLVETEGILRSELATSFIALPTTTGTTYNNEIVMFCPTIFMDGLGIADDGSAVMDIKSPSILSGNYFVNNPQGNTITLLSGSVEPIVDNNTFFASDGTLNTSAFTFDINNPVPAVNGTLCNIVQDNLFTLSDTENFGELGVQTTVDVNAGHAVSAWSVLIPAYSMTPFVIYDILPDGSLVLTNNGSLPSSTTDNISYTLKNGAFSVFSSSNGTLNVILRGTVTALSAGALPISSVLTSNTNYYQNVSGVEYLVTGFVDSTTDQYYLENYNAGDMSGVTVDMRQKVIKGLIGYLSHRGLMLQMSGNLELSLGIQNGVNSYVVAADGVENDGFKENFVIIINGYSYWITEIDGLHPSGKTTITLSGPDFYWKTLGAGGTSVNVTIYQYLKQGATIMGQQFDLPPHTFHTLDRSGRQVITGDLPDNDVIVSLNTSDVPTGSVLEDSVYQQEGISFHIEYADGSSEVGEI
jgi:hypothetical protein